jgi:site-specific DNA-methyltransferase (adenine-specific)
MERCVEMITNEGDTVLDFCMGSGSTGVACKNLNRDFIGIEMNKEYFEIAKQRIENA